MTDDTVAAFYLDHTVVLTEAELVERSGLTLVELRALAESGALPFGGAGRFDIECLGVARTAQRLRDELALEDAHALALVLRLRQRIAALEAQIDALRAGLWR